MLVMRSLGVFFMMFIAAVSAVCPLCVSGIPHACASCASAFVFGADTFRVHLKKKAVKPVKLSQQRKKRAGAHRNRVARTLVK